MSFFFLSDEKSWKQRLQLIIAIILVITCAWLAIRWNQPVEKTIAGYDYAQARQHLQEMTKERHPVGSVAHSRVRDYLVSQIRQLGYEAQLHQGFAFNPDSKSAAQVDNILVRVSATESKAGGKAVLIAGHYDAVPNSYGAGDDGVSMANMLQTLASVKTMGKRSNDLIFLFGDAEEVGLLGAIAFAEQHPWMKDVGMVLNFDNRGNSGPILMFETSAKNGRLIQEFAQATPYAISNSVMYEVYKALPNDTDFSVFRKKDLPGLNFAMIENFSSYHTRHDKGENLNPASQQQQASLMLNLVSHFANQDLSQLSLQRGASNHIYFNLPLIGLVHYSSMLAIPIAVALIVMAILLFIRIRRQRQQDLASKPISVLKSLLGSLIFVVELALFAFLAQRVWVFICRIYPEYASMRDPDIGHYYLLALVLLFITVFAYLQKLLRRWFEEAELSFGAVWVWLLLLGFSSIQFAGASFIFALPLLFILGSWTYLSYKSSSQDSQGSQPPLWTLLAGVLPSVILFAPFVLLIAIALGFYSIGVPILLMSLLLGLCIPLLLQIASTFRRWIPLAFVKVFVVMGALATAHFHNTFPQPAQLMYVAGVKPGQNWWASPNEILNRDALRIFTNKAEQKSADSIIGPLSRFGKRMLWLESADDLNLPRPIIQVQQLETTGDRLRLKVLLQSPLHAPNTQVAIEGAKVFSAKINGANYQSTDSEHWSIWIHGRNKAEASLGNVIELEIEAGKRHSLRVSDTVYQLPPNIATPRLPDDFMAISMATLDIN
ncbi:M28 family peptidase [Undibacterium sp. LX40W]|uniref:Vacuolar membrane protease n=1 Tax=Undibacterium nitidum TaxID=2762298 RepID=A0A923HXF1_9BURK|nr:MULTISPECIES: M28 family peptidase [Undibacterium]MBC3881981.1 M28 family peptidase [Undibacterium nitidum]MBC3892023.1 M28 family peptidase [Undibacterium sp. LX40W]